MYPSEQHLSSRLRHRALFARDFVFLEFRGRDARALDYDGFQDRRPNRKPERLDAITARVIARL
jgi:hypothetical protein